MTTKYSNYFPASDTSGVVGTTVPATRNVNLGEWGTISNGTALTAGDIVQYNGSSYIVVASHTKTGLTVSPPTNNDYQLFASVGATGIRPDIKFIRSNTTPTQPTGNDPAGWDDGVPSGTAAIWITRANKDGNGNLIGSWSTPEQITGIVHRGAYSSGTAYLINQSVTYNGGTYISLTATTGNAPTGTAQANAYWDVLAAPGAQGAPGTPPSAPTGTINLTSSTGVVNLRTVADANGYSGASDATYTFKVPTGVTIRGLGDAGAGAGYGIDTGTWPAGYTISIGLVIESGGRVDGGGGAGGAGGTSGASSGSAGGTGIYLRVNMTGGITVNSGGILRAGGGGGGGASGTFEPGYGMMSGGGGGGGFPNGPGGAGGPDADAGTAGTATGGGVGGAGEFGFEGAGDAGGAGGGYAAAGSIGGGGNPGAGGAAGKAVMKNGFTATVTNNGTLQGAIQA